MYRGNFFISIVLLAIFCIKYNVKLIFYNSDGSISGACGNGTRCVAKLLSKEYGKEEINLETSSGNLHSLILKENIVETNIGIPSMDWDKIPLIKEMNTKNLNITINDINKKKFTGGIAINVGNPHIIFFVENNENYEIILHLDINLI